MNMVAPSNLDILHLLTAIATTTAISIMKSKKTEQNSPELLTTIAVPRCTALKIIQGTGNLHRKKQVQYVNLCAIHHKKNNKHNMTHVQSIGPRGLYIFHYSNIYSTTYLQYIHNTLLTTPLEYNTYTTLLTIHLQIIYIYNVIRNTIHFTMFNIYIVGPC